MLTVDTSALVAIILGESDGPVMAATIIDEGKAQISAANWLETAIVLQTRGDGHAADRLDEVMAQLQITVVPVTPEVAVAARDAFRRYGKGRHPARLNFGDCMSYGLAVRSGARLLFKGADFAQTDITPALA